MPDAQHLATFCKAHRVRAETKGRVTRLVSTRAGAPVARLVGAGDSDKVDVQWWTGQRWGAPGPFGTTAMTLERALDFIADEPAFWIHA